MRHLFSLWFCILSVSAGSLASGQEPAPEAPEKLQSLRDTFEAQRAALSDIYIKKLHEIKKHYVDQGDLNSVLAVIGAIKEAEAMEVEPSPEKGTDSTEAPEGEEATIYAGCDDIFALSINGKEVCKNGGFVIEKTLLKSGDVIAVKGCDTGGGYGFGCVITRNGKPAIATDSTTWQSYKPSNLQDWANPKLITDPQPATQGTNQGPANNAKSKTGAPSEAIWGDPKDHVVFLFYKVP